MTTPPIKVALASDFLQALDALPKSQKSKVHAFIDKFKENPHSSGINYEKIQTFKDPKLRSVRIDQAYRAIVLQPERGNVFVLLWVDHHDKAYRWAENKVYDIHPETGSLQVIKAEEKVLKHEAEPDDRARDCLFAAYRDRELVRLGVPELLLPLVRSLETEDALDKVSEYMPQEAYEALFLLAAGYSYEEVWRDMQESSTSEVDTEDYAAALENPDSKRRFYVVEDDLELSKILNAPLEQWRVFLHPTQRRLVEMEANGPVRVLGGAGTGKTVVALHRAKRLAEAAGDGEVVLFTTFTKNLAADIKENLAKICSKEALRRIEVVNLGMTAVNSYTLWDLAGRVAEQEPDAVALGEKGAEGVLREADLLLPLPEGGRREARLAGPGRDERGRPLLFRREGGAVPGQRHLVSGGANLSGGGEAGDHGLGGGALHVLREPPPQLRGGHARPQGLGLVVGAERPEEPHLEFRHRPPPEPPPAARENEVSRLGEPREFPEEIVPVDPDLPAKIVLEGTGEAGAADPEAEALAEVSGAEGFELRAQRRVAPSPTGRRHVEDLAPGEGVAGGLGPGESPQHEAIARQEREGRRAGLEVDPRETLLSGPDSALSDGKHPDQPLRRPHQEHEGCGLPQGGRAAEPAQPHVEAASGPEGAGTGHEVAPGDLPQLESLEVRRAARPRFDPLGRLAVALQTPGPRGESARQELDRLAGDERRALEGAGHHRAETAHGEDAIDEQPGRPAPGRARGGPGEAARERLPERVHAGAGAGRDRDHRGLGEGPSGQELPRLEDRELHGLLVDEVGLGDGHDPVAHAEELADRHVLPGLRHDPLVGGDHEEHHVDPGGAGDHGAHQALVPGHVQHRDPADPREVEGREAEVDGDAAGLLLGEAVGVDAGQRPDQRGLAVVDVPGRAEHQAAGGALRLSGAR